MTTLIKEMGPTTVIAGYPSAPAQPASRGFCYQEQRGHKYVRRRINETITREGGFIENAAGELVMVPSGREKVSYDVLVKEPNYITTCVVARAAIPATPGAPSHFIPTFNMGWNSGATSITTIVGPAYAQWTVTSSTIGARVGLSFLSNEITGLPVIAAGIEVFDKKLYVIKDDQRADLLGSVSPADTLFLLREAGSAYLRVGTDFASAAIEYKMTGVQMGRAALGAVLYSGEDRVVDAVFVAGADAGAYITTHGSGDPSMRSLAGIGADGSYASGQPLMAPMESDAAAANVGVGAPQMAAMLGVGRANSDVLWGAPSLSPMLCFGTGGAEIVRSYGLGVGYMQPLIASNAYSLTGGIGAGAVSFPRLEGIGADHPYGFASAGMSPIFGWGDSGSAGRAEMWAFGEPAGTQELQIAAYAVINERTRAAQNWAMGTIAVALLRSETSTTASWQSRQEMHTALRESLQLLDDMANSLAGANGAAVNAETWAMNAETGASSAYGNYGFTGFAKIGGKLLGVKPDGIYALDGDTDAGAPINATIAFGKLNFGTSALKHVSNVYIGTSSAGRLYVKVATPQGEYVYKARHYDQKIRQQRFDLGRGLRANYYEFELFTNDGAEFELDTVEFLLAKSARRI